MKKPRNYDDTPEFSGGSEQLEPGNYVCIVKMVEESKSKKTQRPMLNIYLDIADGKYSGYFQRKFDANTWPEKKWPSIVYQLTEDNDGNCSRGLKSFIGAVRDSNPGFDPEAIWNENFCKYFRNRRVGASYRREEYAGNDGESRWNVKAYRFFNADKVDEMNEPKDKPLPAPKYEAPSWDFSGGTEYDGKLPF